jgi:hypothetical protein
MLTFSKEIKERSKDKHIKWLCKCDCGNESIYIATRVRNNKVFNCKSCVSKKQSEIKKTHGMKYTRTYNIWSGLKTRATNKKNKDAKKYCLNGIGVSNEWLKFENFYNDMGAAPDGMSIDRIDNTKGYSKENCRWATVKEQQRNKSTSYIWIIHGEKFESCYAAGDKFKVKPQTIIKWTDGWFDKRRNKQWSPKNGCYRYKRYQTGI